MTAVLQIESSTLPCPKTGCSGQMGVAQTWPGKIEKFRNVQLECPICHLRDFQNFPVPERISSGDCLPFEFGHVVEHAVHGRGMVIYSGPNFTRVCFQGQKGKESEVLTYDLKLAQDAEELNAYRATLEAQEKEKEKGKGQGRSRTTVSVLCPRCDEKTGALFYVKGEQICARCAAEVGGGCDISRRPDGKPRGANFSDPKTPPGHRASVRMPDANPDDLPGSRDMRCELCNAENFKLIFTERLWICEDCRDSVDLGGKVMRGGE